MFNKYTILLLFVFLIIAQPNYNAQTISKTGGICFRIDDNGLISQYRDYVNIFEKHNQKFTFAMNLGLAEFDSPNYTDSIRVFQELGHELLDHTPNHRTNYFITKFDTNDYNNIDGVDHLIGSKVCLKYEPVDTLLAELSDTATVKNDTIIFSSSNYSNIDKLNDKFIYFPTLDQIVLVDKYSNNTAHFTDIWDDSLNLGQINGVKYHTYKKSNINITSAALELLASETIKLASQIHNLEPPSVWIQPGGNFPMLNSHEIKTPFESVGYSSGATYPMSAEKVYNEYNPTGDREFAIQWGDFVEDRDSLELLKNIIADGIAKHKVLIGNGHWYSDDVQEWNNYIAKNDSLLEWATRQSIPIKIYSEWADILYNQTPDPYENIMPPLNVDKDNNGIPDGYGNIHYPVNGLTGQLVSDPTAQDSVAFYSTYNNNYVQIHHILKLGGIEKGANDFSIWTKGAEGNSVRVKFSAPWPGTYFQEFVVPADSSNWMKYDLSQSINGFTNLNIPDTLSLLNVDIFHQSTSPQPIWISGMHLAKKVEKDSLKLTVLNETPIEVGDTILIEVSLFDDFGNPAITSYGYDIEIPDSSDAQLLTSTRLYFNNAPRDTILLKNDTSENFTLSANLVTDSNVEGSVNISLVHPEKFADIKIYLEGPYNANNNKMNNNLDGDIPLISPFNEAPDTLNTIPEHMVDWVLVTLRTDLDDENPNPLTAVDVMSKSAILHFNGKIKQQHHENLGFRVPDGQYYVVVSHRNHLPIMSKNKIVLQK